MNLITFLRGKKTYLVAVVVGVFAALQYLGVSIPDWVYPLLGALGLGSLRAGISK